MPNIEMIREIVGINKNGEICHPFKGISGAKRGKYSYTLSTKDNNSFIAIDEAGLRRMIESGEFNDKGRVRMIPASAKSSSGAGALSIKQYMGRLLPL